MTEEGREDSAVLPSVQNCWAECEVLLAGRTRLQGCVQTSAHSQQPWEAGCNTYTAPHK